MTRIRDAIRATPLEPLAKWAGRQLRYWRMPRMMRMNQRYDAQTREIIRRTPGNYLDVGCHTGTILRVMLENAPDGQHAAFEPLPHLANALRTGFPNVEVFEVALSDRVGEAEFNYVCNHPGYSGIKRHRYPTEPEIELIRVRTDAIDNLIHRPIQLIKIDVEGAELGVLRGAKKTIEANRPVIVFEHSTAAKAYDGSSGDVFDLLVDCGLKVFLLGAWLKGKQPLGRLEFIRQGTNGPNWYFVAAR